MGLNDYLNQASEKLEKVGRKRESKVEKQVLELTQKMINSGEPTTVKAIAEALGKRIQQIHQVVRNGKLLKKVKASGKDGKGTFTLIVPADFE